MVKVKTCSCMLQVFSYYGSPAVKPASGTTAECPKNV